MIPWVRDTTKRVIQTPAAEASWNMRLLANVAPSEKFIAGVNSDLAFTGKYAIQGNYNGYQVWDISTPAKPTLVTAYFCPASQSDVSIYKNLLFVSAEAPTARLDCGAQATPDPVSMDRIRGIRIFDVTNIANPKYVANVQTCRGSHTHTVVTDPNDKDNIYLYVSGAAAIRPAAELAGCTGGSNPNSVDFTIEVIKVPLAHPERSAVVSAPRILDALVGAAQHGGSPADTVGMGAAAAAAATAASARAAAAAAAATDTGAARAAAAAGRGGRGGGGRGAGAGGGRGGAGGGGGTGGAAGAAGAGAATAGAGGNARGGGGGRGAAAPAVPPPALAPAPPTPATGPVQCHDITVYPALGLAGGACRGYGLLLDIHDVAHPRRLGRRVRLQHVLLAFGDVQQRRHQDPFLR